MIPKSAIEKGKRFENWICDQLKEMGIDNNARREIGSGSGKRKGDISTTLDYLIEAKNQNKLQPLAWIEQAKSQARIGYHNPDKWMLVVRNPSMPEFDDTLVIMDFHQLLMLIKKAQEPKTINPDRTLLYKVERAKQAMSDLIKELK